MHLEHVLNIVDAHAEGEMSRVVVGGIIDVPGDSMFEKRVYLESERDDLRQFLLYEPRGSVALSADIVLPSSHPDADFGFVIMESTDYPAMSGTNTINTATVMLEIGIVEMTEPVTKFNLEAPAGIIAITAECEAGKCKRVTFENQPSFVVHQQEPVRVPELGTVLVDVVYGGAFFAMVDATAFGFSVVPDEARELSRLGQLVTRAAAEQLPVVHPDNPAIHTVSFTDWLAPPRAGGDGRNANIVAPGRVDRSACGTATCARMAALHALGRLDVGETYVSESILDTNFVGRVAGTAQVGPYQAIIPTISGRAWIYATQQMGRHPSDPFGHGHTLADNWGTDMAEELAARRRAAREQAAAPSA